MANAKSRLKAPKSAATKRGRCKSKRSLSSKKSTDPTTPEGKMVIKRPSLNSLTTDEKVNNLLPTEPLPGDSEFIETKSLRTRKIISQGRIAKKKSKTDLRAINNILKSDPIVTSTKKSNKNSSQHKRQPLNNNNESDISDQNEPKEINDDKKNKVSKTKASSIEKKSKTISKKTNIKKTEQQINKNPSKTKQVTLSNGLVLTLALFQCDYCKKMFSNKSSLRRHIYIHLKIKPLQCKKCPKKFRSKVNLQHHMETFHADLPYLCNICQRTFTLEENLALHLATHIKNENAFKCIYCEKQFSYNLLLIQHEQQHLVTGRYQCTICTMSYDCRNHLSMHMKSHMNIKDYICQYCGKEFQRMNSMKRHVQICHGGHRIQCPICNKKLKGHLTEHMRTHKQAKPHKCEVCGQRFTQSTQLKVHMRSHSGLRPYTCGICKRPFSHSNALMMHIRRHTGEKPFACAMCPLFFSQLPHMKAHMRSIHGKNLPYKCPKCDQFFKLKSEVESHTKTCTVGERELTFEERIQASVQYEEVEPPPPMSLSRMRFLLALLFTMIASKEKLKFLGFNKRLIDDLLVESLEAMGQEPCKDESLAPIKRLKHNIQLLLNGTVPQDEMAKFRRENKTTEELLELLTDEKKKERRGSGV